MGRIQSALGKARREAERARTETGNRDKAAQANEARHFAAPGERIEAASRSDLLNKACAVTLDAVTLNSNRIRGIDSSEPGEAAYKMLRTRVLQRLRSNNWQKLAITSPRANAGKTLTAINLAISLAREPNQQVILVDLDLRNPKIGKYLGLDPKYGLGSHFKQDVGIEEVLLKPTNLPRLYILPGGDRSEHSSELLASQKMATLTQTLISTSPSTIVIFDMPPLLEADDMLTFMPQVDALLFVVAQGETTQSDLERSIELFSELNVLGTVLNKSGDEAPSEYY